MKKHHQFKVGDLVYSPTGENESYKTYHTRGYDIYRIVGVYDENVKIWGNNARRLIFPSVYFKPIGEDELWF